MGRFSRQEILKEFGSESQNKLSSSKVLVVGAGGLGCPALQYLAASGIGTLGVIDGDSVSITNLNRQILFGFPDLGHNKAERAVQKLQSLYNDIQFHAYPFFLGKEHVFELFSEYDIIIDGSDNFPTRYLINDACVLLGKPLVLGAIYQSEGQLSVFDNKAGSAQYRDLYPNMPTLGEIPNCQEAGVLGVLPGIIGTMQASETIKLLTGYGTTLKNKLFLYNLKTNSCNEISIPIQAGKQFPKTKEEVLSTEYSTNCTLPQEISWYHAINLLNTEGALIYDIREKEELPKLKHIKIREIPFKKAIELEGIDTATRHLLLCCQSGVRSRKLGVELQKKYPHIEIFSIEGGVSQAPSEMFG